MNDEDYLNQDYDSQEVDTEITTEVTRVEHHRFFVHGVMFDDAKYRKLILTLFKASPMDKIDFIINCDGGDMYIMNTIVHAFRSSGIRTKAIVTGKCYSAASMLTLACDEVDFGPFGEMMIHTATIPNPEGTPRNSVSKANFDMKTVERCIDETYADFLTKKEIEKVKECKEIWLDSEEVNERLVKWRAKRTHW